MRTGQWFDPLLSNFFYRIDNSVCYRGNSPLTADHVFNIGFYKKQPLAWKEYLDGWLGTLIAEYSTQITKEFKDHTNAEIHYLSLCLCLGLYALTTISLHYYKTK